MCQEKAMPGHLRNTQYLPAWIGMVRVHGACRSLGGTCCKGAGGSAGAGRGGSLTAQRCQLLCLGAASGCWSPHMRHSPAACSHLAEGTPPWPMLTCLDQLQSALCVILAPVHAIDHSCGRSPLYLRAGGSRLPQHGATAKLLIARSVPLLDAQACLACLDHFIPGSFPPFRKSLCYLALHLAVTITAVSRIQDKAIAHIPGLGGRSAFACS